MDHVLRKRGSPDEAGEEAYGEDGLGDDARGSGDAASSSEHVTEPADDERGVKRRSDEGEEDEDAAGGANPAKKKKTQISAKEYEDATNLIALRIKKLVRSL